MSSGSILVPVIIFIMLAAFAGILWPWQAKSTADRGLDTKEHSERIYKVFQFYLQVTLALTGAMGYLRLGTTVPLDVIREGMLWLGAFSLGISTIFIIFLWCHLGSKIRRWENIEWLKFIFLQEIWMAIAIFSYGTALWVVAHTW